METLRPAAKQLIADLEAADLPQRDLLTLASTAYGRVDLPEVRRVEALRMQEPELRGDAANALEEFLRREDQGE